MGWERALQCARFTSRQAETPDTDSVAFWQLLHLPLYKQHLYEKTNCHAQIDSVH